MPMTPGEIKKELEDRKLSMAAVGRRARPKAVSRVAVSRNVHQMPGHKSARVRRLIARAIERSPEEVFGEAA